MQSGSKIVQFSSKRVKFIQNQCNSVQKRFKNSVVKLKISAVQSKNSVVQFWRSAIHKTVQFVIVQFNLYYSAVQCSAVQSSLFLRITIQFSSSELFFSSVQFMQTVF